MTVVDASVVVAAFVDSSDQGDWARTVLAAGALAAPHSMPAEAVNALRRAVLSGSISADAAALAVADVVILDVELFPFHAFADRAWELRSSVTVHDAWYVGLAEVLGRHLATLDRRLVRASGPQCEFLTPPA